LTKLEEFCGGDNTGWNRFECTSLEVGLEITRPNRGGAYVSVWPPYSDSETINRVISTWQPSTGLGFPAEYCELEQGLWCALFGAGMEDCSMACFCGDVEASFKLDYPFNAGF
jgi:hypothetical protein